MFPILNVSLKGKMWREYDSFTLIVVDTSNNFIILDFISFANSNFFLCQRSYVMLDFVSNFGNSLINKDIIYMYVAWNTVKTIFLINIFFYFVIPTNLTYASVILRWSRLNNKFAFELQILWLHIVYNKHFFLNLDVGKMSLIMKLQFSYVNS